MVFRFPAFPTERRERKARVNPEINSTKSQLYIVISILIIKAEQIFFFLISVMHNYYNYYKFSSKELQ